MDFRKRRVLQAIIDDYVATAEPVGSRTIARKYNLGVSPATIRNEMADLEELGYLEQPHTSAGRVPSDKGYRFYVDNLMEAARIEEDSRRMIRETLSRRSHEMAGLMQQAARLLAEATGQLVLISGPEVRSSICRYVQVLPLKESRLSLVIVTEEGFMHSKVLEFDGTVSPDQLQCISRMLTGCMRGQTLETVAVSLLPRLQREMRALRELLNQALEAILEDLQPGTGERVFVGGAVNLLRQPEFRDVAKASAVLSVLEGEQMARQLLQSCGAESDGVSVAIGSELNSEHVADCSLVAAGYHVGKRIAGRLGVLGPRRMEYARVVALVDEISREMTVILSNGHI